jgi:hypothetical protein
MFDAYTHQRNVHATIKKIKRKEKKKLEKNKINSGNEKEKKRN